MRRLDLAEVERKLADFDKHVANPTPDQLEARGKVEYALRNAKNLCILFGTIDEAAVGEAKTHALKLEAMYMRTADDGPISKPTLH